jgi:hypothetical protein
MLTPEDMGLKLENVSDAFKLGKKMLVPENVLREFRTVENKARHMVNENSFEFPIANARFVPKIKIERVIAELKLLQEAYDTLTFNLVNNYARYQTEMAPIFKEAAEIAYAAQAPSGVQEFSIESQEAEKAAFIERFMSRINNLYPNVNSLASKFSLSWDVYEIAPTTGIATEEYRIQAREKIGHFIDDVVSTLRTQTMELCTKITSNIKSGKVIRGKTLSSLREYIDEFSEMNFVGDTLIEEQLNSLRSNFLNVHENNVIADNSNLQEELGRRLNTIVETIEATSDISTITGSYRRKISFED